MRSRLISMEEEVEFDHELPRLRFSAKPLTPESLDDSDDYSGVVFDFELRFRSAINHRYYDVRSSDDVGTRRRSFVFQSYEPGEKTVFFDQRMLTSGDRKVTYEMLSSYLRSFGITRSGGTGDLHDRIVDEIIDKGSELRPIEDPARTRKVLGLYVEISGDYFKYRCAECRARMTGMVPASNSSIKKALKAVVVGRKRGRDGEERGDVEERKRKRGIDGVSEGESCTVCMEEFKGGSKAACMPCKHVFHGNCIVKWLRQSRHCPVCRFDVSV